ncbi:MAG: penicillin-binding protein 1C [Burkholderiaceae bacterium]|nr:penicillin-binding protein 1C [Pseudomonadota bacterium]MBS0597403.1 penicillin-binding protein 1C [Pseudomonadota bacterium]MCO5117743.1 penicillin-binding protein 1C [Burkholderiaceae bacterium]MCP5218585.1 penicillin-binding protein 1C [Burkholderiaceae bacterium]
MSLSRPLRFLCVLCVLAFAASAHAQSFDAVRAEHRPSETLILDRHGEPIERVRTDAQARRGAWVRLADISPALQHALVLSEDQRFYEHSGVDWRAVSAAAWANLWNTRTRGASTLTMQLAGLLDDDLRLGTGGRSLRQKIGQAVMATRLEASWRKDQILEAYLNLVPLRGELVGIDALARTLFAKAPHGLTESEAALTAALVRAPNASPARVAQRACGVLKAMRGPRQATDCMALDMQAELALARRAWPAQDGIAPHYARRLLGALPAGQPAPATLRSTLDARLQRIALQSLQQHIKELRGHHVEDGAALVLDNASGEVLAWVGSTGDLSRAREVDAVTAPRQPGSTLKPLLYAQAIAERRLTAASLLHDSPAHLQTASGLYIPQNYDLGFKGWVSVRSALASSLNVPAVRTIVMVSPRAFHRQLGQLGIALPQGGDYYGDSLALGSAEVTLLQLTNAYRALANGGRYCEVARPSTAGPREGCHAALDPRAAFIAGDILADRNARALTFGLDSILATRFWSAVKTGTSKDMRDNWAVGWSQRYTVGVWVGNAGGGPMWDVSGTSGAAPVWAELMRALHQRTPSRAPAPPPGLVHARVRFGDGLEVARQEWFIAGTEQAVFAIDSEAYCADAERAAGPIDLNSLDAAHHVPARITRPQDGTILALDPDIPPTHQRLLLQADPGAANPQALRWWIDAREVGRGPQAQWLPWPGRHVLQLRDARGTVQDERRIEVRGATVKPARAGG